jgi:hypothetical protein
VQDLFAFLHDWFGEDGRANVNGVDGVTSEDLLRFLEDWFAGC